MGGRSGLREPQTSCGAFGFYQRGADEGESDVVISGKQGQEVWNLAASEESFHTSAETALKPGSPAVPGDPGCQGGGGR